MNTTKGQIVRLEKSKNRQPNSKTRQTKGLKLDTPIMVPPFKVAYTIASGDELNPEPTEVLAVLPYALEKAAWEYIEWDVSGKKGKIPLLLSIVEEHCDMRVAVAMGLGSCLYFESSKDAKTLLELYG